MKFNFNTFDIKNNIAFQKKLMAKCAIPKGNGQKEDCAIYLLDRSLIEDRFYYQKAKKDNPIWNNRNALQSFCQHAYSAKYS